MVDVVLSVAFGYEGNEVIRKLLEDFRDMINFCIEKALESNVTSYAKLRKLVYGEWKERWDYSTHFCHSACRIASSMLKSWRRKVGKGEAKKPPKARKLFIRFDPQLVKFEGDRLRISIRPRRFVYVQLKYGEYQRKFIEEWRKGKLKVGEITMNGEKVIVPFRKEVDLTNPKDWIAIDINESNITGVSSKGEFFQLDTSEVKRIHDAYFEKRRKVQRKVKGRKTRKKLLAKYGSRETNKVRNELHKIANIIVEKAKQSNCGIILEDLKNIRKHINYGRKMNRRLHSWNFRQLQSYIEYKAKLNGIPVVYVNPKGSSSHCPICGEKLAPNGQWSEKLCRKCEIIWNRDVVACLNLLKMWGVPFPPKAPESECGGRFPVTECLYPVTGNQNGKTRKGVIVWRRR